MTSYVNVTQPESLRSTVPTDRPRRSSVGSARDAQVEEGWPWQGAAVIVLVEGELNLGVVN